MAGLLTLPVARGESAAPSGVDDLVPQSIAFWDAARGLAVFTVTGRCPRTTCAVVGVTADGGRTWRLTFRVRSASGLAVAPGGRDAWLAQDSCATWWSCRPRLLRSQDGGVTWRIAGHAALSPTFPTRTVGVGALYDANGLWSLVQTRDRGRHWSHVDSPCRRRAQYLVPSFATPQLGWVLCAGQPGAGHQLKAIFGTGDGGRKWQLVMNTGWSPAPDSSAPRGIPDAGYAKGIAFSTSRGWIWQSEFFSYTSTDRGRTWRPVEFGLAQPAALEIEDLSAVGARIAYALARLDGGLRRELLRTTDGGHSWQIARTWRYP
jgi:hypothetical protein